MPHITRSSSISIIAQLLPFIESRALSALDLEFGRSLLRHHPETPYEVILAACCVSAALNRGNICLELESAQALLAPLSDTPTEIPPLPVPEAWLSALTSSPLVSDGSRLSPLVLEGGRLYLYRYFDYQRRLASNLAARRDLIFKVDEARLGDSLERLFLSSRPDPSQRRAAETAIRRGLTIISGGPGSGKTSTVIRILGALLEQHPTLHATLVAPTGKAAARMSASIREQKPALSLSPDLMARLPEDARTIHAVLGFQPRTPSHFAHGLKRPLETDVVVVDEASMVDLALMTKLVEAVPPGARLILLGDRDQLASVEAGHVLGDIADAASPRTSTSEAPALGGTFVALEHAHRFDASSGIGQLAEAIRLGDEDALLSLLDTDLPEITRLEPDPKRLEQVALGAWSELELDRASPDESLARLGRFQVLCAHREGPYGANLLSERLDQHFASQAPRERRDSEWYPGRPIMVLVNDRAQDLWNGDTGVALPLGESLRVHFPPSQTSRRGTSIPIPQLPRHAPLYATTVHKAQGSGFDHVLIVLQARASPIVTRELLYTAITRARHKVTLMASIDSLKAAVRTRVMRASGLRHALEVATRVK